MNRFVVCMSLSLTLCLPSTSAAFCWVCDAYNRCQQGSGIAYHCASIEVGPNAYSCQIFDLGCVFAGGPGGDPTCNKGGAVNPGGGDTELLDTCLRAGEVPPVQFVTGVFVELSPAAARTLFGEQRYRALPVASMNGGAFTVVQAITASGVAAAEVSPVAALKVFGRALTDPVVYTAHGGTFSLFAAPVGAVGGSEVSVGVEGDTQPALAMPGQLLLGRVSLNGREYGLAVVSRVFGSEPGVSYESVEADPDLGGAVAAFEADNALYRGAWSEAGIGFADIEAPTPTRPGTWGELKIRYR